MTQSNNPDTTRDVLIEDTQPSSIRNWADLLYAIAALLFAMLLIATSSLFSGLVNGAESDARSAGKVLSWIVTDLPCSMLQQALLLIIISAGVAYLAIHKHWLRASIAIITVFISYGAVWLLSYLIATMGNHTLLLSLQSQSSRVITELLPDMYAVLVAFLTVIGPKRENPFVKNCWTALFIATPIFILASWHSLTGMLIAMCLGRTIGALIRFMLGTTNKGAWGYEIVEAIESIGLQHIVRLSRRRQQADHLGVLRSSLDDDLIENSRLYEAEDIHGTRYVVSVLDNQMHIPGYLNQLWQWVRLIDVPVRRDWSARHSIHHHLSMLLVLRNLHLPTANVYGVADSEQSSIMVFHERNRLTPCNLNTLTVQDAQRLMRYVAVANARGITHRRITPESLARLENGTLLIAGWQNGDVASDANNIALDKVQLLTLLATCMSVEDALTAAEHAWGKACLASLLPFMQKAAIPASTKALASWNKRLFATLCNQLNALVSDHVDEDLDSVRLARFNVRFFVGLLFAVIAIAVIVTQWHPQAIIAALHRANPHFVLLCFSCSMLAWIASATTLGAFMDETRPHAWTLFLSQASSGITVVSMPAGVGPAIVNMRLLRNTGYTSTQATAITSAVWLVQAMMTASVIFFIGIFTGHNVLSRTIPTHMLITVVGIVTLAACAAMAIKPVRKLVTKRYLPLLFSYIQQIRELLTHPYRMILGMIGGLIVPIVTGLGYWLALLAFNCQSNPMAIILIFLLANTAGSAVPTPGGLGAVEATLTVAFTSVGIPPTIALSATLLYRLMFYWARIPLGALAMRHLVKQHLL